MSTSFSKQMLLKGGLAAVATALFATGATAQTASPPDFSSNGAMWQTANGVEFKAVEGSPPPVTNDPAHPYVSNAIAARTGQQPNYRIGDLTNPNLKQWAKDVMKKDNDEVLAGKIGYTANTSCRPAGVPALMLSGGPFYFIQTRREVAILMEMDHQVRHVYMDVPHSAGAKPSCYGESVGHYEGDTLVIDTIGQSTKTFIDNFRTPHSEKLHVIERWRMIENGKQIQVQITVEDPDTFNQPWQVTKLFQRRQGTLQEDACAENNFQFEYNVPVADRPDF
jgi:hypothetical protein